MLSADIFPNYELYLEDESRIKGNAEKIFFPETIEDAALAAKYAAGRNLPITAQGARTGLFGRAVPESGIILNFERMNKILGLNGSEHRAELRVEAGVRLNQIEEFLKLNNPKLFFPPAPSEKTSSVGGLFGSGASGYADMAVSFFRSALWMSRGGEISEIDNPEKIAELFGKGGENGAGLEFTIGLAPKPARAWGVVYFFDDDKTLFDFFEKIKSPALAVAEYFNGEALKLANINKPAALYVELWGGDARALEAELFSQLDLFGEGETWAADSEAEIEKFRQIRHKITEAVAEKTPPGAPRLEALLKAEAVSARGYCRIIRADLENSGLAAAVYGRARSNHLSVAFTAGFEAGAELIKKWAGMAAADGGSAEAPRWVFPRSV